MVHIVPAACQFQPDRSRGVVVLESDVEGPDFSQAFEELSSTATRTMALGYAAQQGVAPAHINGNTIGPYPINSEGYSLDQVHGPKGEPLPQTDPRMQPARYRFEVPVVRPI